MFEAIQDMNLCYTLEQLIGRDAVIDIINHRGGGDWGFDDYPKTSEIMEKIREDIVNEIKEQFTCRTTDK